MTLAETHKGQKGTVISIRPATSENTSQTSQRLLEMGVIEGALFEVIHEAPLGGDPLAIRIRGEVLALGRREAECVEVEVHS